MVSRLKINSKTNKSSYLNDNITIDAKHNEMVQHFKLLHDSIPSLKDDLKKMIAEYNNKDQNRKHDIDYIIYRDKLRDEINELKDKINRIINNEDLNKYYLEVGTLLHNYYENVENSKVNENDHTENFEDNLLNYDNESYFDIGDDMIINNEDEFNKNIETEPKKEFKSVLNFFNSTNEIENNTKPNISSTNTSTAYTSTKISDFVKEESKFKKKDILDEYLQKIDSKYISKIKYDQTICKCPDCNTEMTLFPSDGIQICENCGYQQNIFIESDKPSFKDPPMEVCYFSYRRINHYNEWLAQVQAKESTEIPNEVYDKILLEIKKERIPNLEKLDTKKIRQYLKRLKLNKYYDHAAHILYQINGVQPLNMTKELEEKLRLMFKEIQAPFMEVCPKSRKNFLNYAYVLHKFVELLGLDEYKVYFPLLKDREKLHQTDMIWKKICEKLGWHFIKSI